MGREDGLAWRPTRSSSFAASLHARLPDSSTSEGVSSSETGNGEKVVVAAFIGGRSVHPAAGSMGLSMWERGGTYNTKGGLYWGGRLNFVEFPHRLYILFAHSETRAWIQSVRTEPDADKAPQSAKPGPPKDRSTSTADPVSLYPTFLPMGA